MSLPRRYNRLLRKQLRHYAAWHPVGDPYEVGDFGAFRGGIFVKLGNVEEFGVNPNPQPGAAATKLDFTSSGVTTVRTAAGATVDVFPEEPLEAKLDLTFSGDSSFYLRSTELSVAEMPSVDAVAHQLKGKRDANGRRWKLRWKVIRKVYTAVDPAILASAERDASFTLTGRADALKRLELGHASADISVTSTKSDAIKISGGTGPVALDLFKVRVTGSAGLESVPQLVDLDDDWADEPEDDPKDAFDMTADSE